ncbi:hypothetical protein HDE_05965 [Halotydeus destructor]|nr:hypothetical protein HDE_05965 [Halotydeus destructor]
MVKALKEEKARIRKKKHEEKQSTLYLHDTGVPEVDHLIEKVEVIDTESHTITISAMDTAQIAGQLNYSMGPNKGVTKLKKIDSNPKKKGAN